MWGFESPLSHQEAFVRGQWSVGETEKQVGAGQKHFHMAFSIWNFVKLVQIQPGRDSAGNTGENLSTGADPMKNKK